jgi:hypothetical protein
MRFYKVLQLQAVVALWALAGCATPSKPEGGFHVDVDSSPEIQITNVKALVEPYGLVLTGAIHLAPNLPPMSQHSVDIIVTGPDGAGIRKLTSAYYPTPKPDRKKAQHAHFTAVMYTVPPPGSMIDVSLTLQPTPDQPVIVNPE